MKILIIRNAFAEDFGGAEQYALKLSVVLNEEGHQVILLSRVPKLLHEAKKAGVQYARGPWFSRQDWGILPRILRPLMFFWYGILVLWYTLYIIIHRIDLVHAQSRDDFIGATIAARLTRRSIIWTDHADLKHLLKDGGVNIVGRLVHSCGRRADSIIAVSKNERSQILRYAGDLSVEVVHNGAFRPDPTPIEKPKREVVIGCCSRLVEAKGIGDLILAYSNLKPKRNTSLWIVGDGSDRKKFEVAASELGVDRSIKFWGFRDNAQDYMASFDIFVHPSHSEGFSLSIVEAAMLGLPIIATDVGGNPEIINSDTGILVPAKNPPALTSALEKLFDNLDSRRELGRAAQKLAFRSFEFRDIVKREIIPIYNRFVRPKNASLV